MPVVITNPPYPNQYAWSGAAPPSTQLTFGQMLRELTIWNPDLDAMSAARLINNVYRQVIDRRQWYGLKVRGNISINAVVNNGQASVINGSNIAQGYNTTWTQSLVGLQFRVGFTYPYQTIMKVDETLQQLTLDTLYGGQAITAGGYNIVEAYVEPGANIKYFLWAVNQQQGWPMEVNANVQMLNEWDPWRQSLGWSTVLATRSVSAAGGLVLEVWPTPYGNQVFPFEAYTQPPDMFGDNDSPAPFIGSHVIVAGAVAMAKVIGGRGSKWYDPTVYQLKMAEFEKSLSAMEDTDDWLDQKSVVWDYGQEDGRAGFGPGSTFAQSHDV